MNGILFFRRGSKEYYNAQSPFVKYFAEFKITNNLGDVNLPTR